MGKVKRENKKGSSALCVKVSGSAVAETRGRELARESLTAVGMIVHSKGPFACSANRVARMSSESQNPKREKDCLR